MPRSPRRRRGVGDQGGDRPGRITVTRLACTVSIAWPDSAAHGAGSRLAEGPDYLWLSRRAAAVVVERQHSASGSRLIDWATCASGRAARPVQEPVIAPAAGPPAALAALRAAVAAVTDTWRLMALARVFATLSGRGVGVGAAREASSMATNWRARPARRDFRSSTGAEDEKACDAAGGLGRSGRPRRASRSVGAERTGPIVRLPRSADIPARRGCRHAGPGGPEPSRLPSKGLATPSRRRGAAAHEVGAGASFGFD